MQEAQRVGLVEEVEEVVALPVGAVVVAFERGVAGDLARQHVGRVWDARDETDAVLGHRRLGSERAPGLLLEQVEHGLQRDDRPVPQRVEPLVDPADRRTERHAELTHLALGADLHELVPQRVVADGLDADVVQLQQVDVVPAQAAQGRLDLGPHRLRPPVLRTLRVPGRDARCVDVVADLRGDHHVVAPPEQVGEDRLAEAVVAVDRRGVEEGDAGVEGGVHETGLVVDLAPPVGRDRPRAEPDLGDDEVASSEPSIPHGTRG